MKWKKTRQDGKAENDKETVKPTKKAARKQEPKVATTPHQELISSQVVALQRLSQAGPKRIGPYDYHRTFRSLRLAAGTQGIIRFCWSGKEILVSPWHWHRTWGVKYEGKVNGAIGTLQSLRAEIHHNVDATVGSWHDLASPLTRALVDADRL
eukprot:756096-Hanusia_phi.AAC.2